MSESFADSPRRLVTVATDTEAGVLITALSASGITANSTGGHTAAGRTMIAGSVDIWVRQQDLQRAQRALEEIEKDAPEIDWSQVDVGEPEDD